MPVLFLAVLHDINVATRVIYNILSIMSEHEFHQIVVRRQYEQAKQQQHTNHLCALHELVAWLFACNDLKEQEHRVSAVECGDWQDVHESEYD